MVPSLGYTAARLRSGGSATFLFCASNHSPLSRAVVSRDARDRVSAIRRASSLLSSLAVDFDGWAHLLRYLHNKPARVVLRTRVRHNFAAARECDHYRG